MERVTITMESDLLADIDAAAEARGYQIDPRSFAISFARAFSKMLRMRMHQGLAWRRLSMSMTMPRAIFQSGSCRISTIIMICLLRRCMFISTKAVAWR